MLGRKQGANCSSMVEARGMEPVFQELEVRRNLRKMGKRMMRENQESGDILEERSVISEP